MQRRRGSLAWVWLVLTGAALIIGLVAMHHLPPIGSAGESHHGVATASPAHAMSVGHTSAADAPCPCDSGDPAPAPSSQQGGHSGLEHLLIHLCLAVLAGGLLLGGVLAWWSRRRHPTAAPPGTAVPAGWFSPPRPVAPQLTELCVLRL